MFSSIVARRSSMLVLLSSTGRRRGAAAPILRGRLLSSEAPDAKSPFSFVENPIVGSLVLVGLSGVVGVGMYYTDDPLPSTPEEAVWQKSRMEKDDGDGDETEAAAAEKK